jgi:hypothetical protein
VREYIFAARIDIRPDKAKTSVGHSLDSSNLRHLKNSMFDNNGCRAGGLLFMPRHGWTLQVMIK